ncbi:MAG TPA: hypothetical protein VGS22_23285 [Thermoanaerobaculia bacterium]|nr:hypothetical protein [Thermoanaerobaculia bacterium]
MDDHVSDEQVRRLSLGPFDGRDWRNLVHHLVVGCPVCRERAEPSLRALLHPEPPDASEFSDQVLDPDLDRAYEAAIDRAFDRVLPYARRRFPFGLPQSELPQGLSGPPLVEALLAKSFAARYKNPHEMWRFATFAQLAARAFNESEATREAADLLARASAELANACRVNDDFTGAERAFDQARLHFERGTGDRALEARLLELRASYLNGRRLFREACDLLLQVERIRRESGDRHLAARAVVKRGIYSLYDDDPRSARELLARGLRDLDQGRDPELFLSARQSYIAALVECDEPLRAAHELLGSGLGEALAESPLNLAKLRWLEGRIYAALGKHALAEGALEAAREAFHHHGQGFNSSLVGLDLAGLWLEQGRTRNVMDLAQEITEIFARLGVSAEAERAIRYVYVACELNIATVGKIRYVKRFLERAERDPYLAFVYPESAAG